MCSVIMRSALMQLWYTTYSGLLLKFVFIFHLHPTSLKSGTVSRRSPFRVFWMRMDKEKKKICSGLLALAMAKLHENYYYPYPFRLIQIYFQLCLFPYILCCLRNIILSLFLFKFVERCDKPCIIRIRSRLNEYQLQFCTVLFKILIKTFGKLVM